MSAISQICNCKFTAFFSYMQIYLDFFYQINASIYINAKKSLGKRDEWCKKSLEKCKLQTGYTAYKQKILRFSCTCQKKRIATRAKTLY